MVCSKFVQAMRLKIIQIVIQDQAVIQDPAASCSMIVVAVLVLTRLLTRLHYTVQHAAAWMNHYL
jgi:hypothetical protein